MSQPIAPLCHAPEVNTAPEVSSEPTEEEKGKLLCSFVSHPREVISE
jgi:hypothetical protein